MDPVYVLSTIKAYWTPIFVIQCVMMLRNLLSLDNPTILKKCDESMKVDVEVTTTDLYCFYIGFIYVVCFIAGGWLEVTCAYRHRLNLMQSIVK